MFKNKLAGSLIIFLNIVVGTCKAVENDRIELTQIPHFEEKAVVDGVIDEAIWQKASRFTLHLEIDPAENITAKVATTALIYEDGETLFVAFDAKDPNAGQIRSYLSDRDKLSNSDYVGIALDTFNDSRKAYQFYTNAIGVQADLIIDEIAGSKDFGWDAIWQSAGKTNEFGYQVEMAIPLKSLRFKKGQSLKNWGIKLTRVWIRDVEHVFSNVSNNRDNECELCQFEKVSGFSSITPANNLTLIPALTYTRSDTRDASASSDWQTGEFQDRESLDVRWGINQNTFVNATINPDFSQVEADELQLEINKRFAIFIPEKRAFFLDGIDYFSNWSRLVYTRLFIEPDYGLKLTGKSGEHSYGLITLKDKDTSFLLPDNQSSRLIRLSGKQSENQIVRYRYDLGKQGNIGFTYTQRDADDYNNEMFSLDGKYWLGDSDYFKFQAMSSDTLNPFEVHQGNAQLMQQSGSAYSVNYTHAGRNWEWYLTHHQFGKGFRADSGFVSKSNWKSSAIEVAHNWYPSDQNQWWKSATFDLQLNKISDLDGNRLNNKQGLGIAISGIYQSEIGFVYFNDQQNYVPQRFDINVPLSLFAQNYSVQTYQTYFGVTPTAGLDFNFSLEWGDEIDFSTANLGKVRTLIPTVNYQINDHWKLDLEYISQKLDVAGSEIFDVNLYNLRAAYQIDVNSYFRVTLQASEQASNQSLASQLLYSYQLDPFTLFFFGYSDDAFKDVQINRFRKTDRTLFMKFSYAWQL